jgi:hypothetical protein
LESTIQTESAFQRIVKIDNFTPTKPIVTMATQKQSKTLNTILWTIQVLLSVTLIWAASRKLTQTADDWQWTKDNVGLSIFTGLIDILAAVGLVLPGLLRIKPKLTAYAALGLIALMIAASIFHITRGESSQIGVNIFIALLAAFVAWGRLKTA